MTVKCKTDFYFNSWKRVSIRVKYCGRHGSLVDFEYSLVWAWCFSICVWSWRCCVVVCFYAAGVSVVVSVFTVRVSLWLYQSLLSGSLCGCSNLYCPGLPVFVLVCTSRLSLDICLSILPVSLLFYKSFLFAPLCCDNIPFCSDPSLLLLVFNRLFSSA